MGMDPSAAQRRHVDALLSSVGVAALPGEVLTILGGETVRVTATIEYRGPASPVTLYGAIGNRGAITFDEVWSATAPALNLPESVDWVQHTLSVDIVTDGDHPGLFDLYVKLLETGAPGMPELADCIQVVGAVEFQNFAITSYDKV